ncbi:MAG: STAS domain-containing protein [Coriobacteriia bacterium]|nr:STAS domain-containing protein [Coriobacteriia bacterium]MBN2839391.1 STAS domain-containing protein [Coriobacteriia bacterium]
MAAGVVVGVVAIPLAMAFAIAAGAKPEQGLYTAMIAGLVVTLFGGSRVQIAGPTGAFAVLLAGVTATYGLGGLQVVTMLAGIILVVFGVARLGNVIKYIPESVILGFTAGIAVVIWTGQWPNFFGLPATTGEHFAGKLAEMVRALPALDLTTTLLGVVSVIVIVLWPKIPVLGKIPGPLVALVGGTVFVAIARPESVATIGSAFGGLPSGLPALALPDFAWGDLPDLVRPAFAIALLGAIESLLSATVADGMTGTKHSSNQELLGQGAANIAASLFGGFAATGAIARTATNIRHGGNSPIAGIFHVLTVVLVVVALAPLAANVPLATLAAILFVVAFNMSEIGRIVRIAQRAPRSDVAVMLITLALTVFADLVVAVEVGVILALLNFFRRMTAAVGVTELDEGAVADASPEVVPAFKDVLVFTIDGPFFFGAVDQFEAALLHTNTEPRAVVVSLENVPFIDLTALASLQETIEQLHKHEILVALCCANTAVASRLAKADITGGLPLPATASMADALRTVGGRVE